MITQADSECQLAWLESMRVGAEKLLDRHWILSQRVAVRRNEMAIWLAPDE